MKSKLPKLFFWAITLLAVKIVTVWLYRAPFLLRTPIEPIRQAVDRYSENQFASLNKAYILFHYLVVGNSDAYLFRPPRILSGNTIIGRQAYSVYGIVRSWDANMRIMELDAFTGKHMYVRFDPEADQSIAIIPHLDKYGARVDKIGENELVTEISDPRFSTLFCPSDVVKVSTEKLTDITNSSKTAPTAAVEILLSFTLCHQALK